MTTDVMEAEGTPEQPKIGDIYSVCRDCIFAEWVGDTQTGCEFDRLESFEENGADVIGVDDGEKQFFIISGRFCNAHRNEKWGRHFLTQDWKERAAEEFRLRCEILIYVDESHSMNDVFHSIESVLDQTLPAYYIRVVINKPLDDVRKFVTMMQKLKPKIRWEVNQVVESDSTFGDAIDFTVVHVKATYYAVCKAGYRFPLDFIENLNRAVNEHMERFVALLPDEDGNGLVVQTILHNTLNGHRMKDVIDKIAEIAEEESTGHMIKKYEDLLRWQ